MKPNPDLAIWDAIYRASVIGSVGHHLTHPAGPAHPLRTAPAWVTSHGCDLAALHAAHSALVVHDRRGEDRECSVGKIRTRRTVKRTRRGNVVAIRRSA